MPLQIAIDVLTTGVNLVVGNPVDECKYPRHTGNNLDFWTKRLLFELNNPYLISPLNTGTSSFEHSSSWQEVRNKMMLPLALCIDYYVSVSIINMMSTMKFACWPTRGWRVCDGRRIQWEVVEFGVDISTSNEDNSSRGVWLIGGFTAGPADNILWTFYERIPVPRFYQGGLPPWFYLVGSSAILCPLQKCGLPIAMLY